MPALSVGAPEVTKLAPENLPAQPPLSPVEHLRELIEEAEQALASDEEISLPTNNLDEAKALVATWPAERLTQPEVASLLVRLKNLEQQIKEESIPADVIPEMREDVVRASSAALSAERSQVFEAEKNLFFDFPIDLNDTVLTWVNLFTTSRKGFVEGALTRATQYLPMIRQVFEEEGVPKDLLYLAVVESGFKNSAKSRAKAVGMWQFIRSTGRLYGLKGDAWVEERRDPVKATRAAARYLKRLYEDSGDWYLALLGYNAGPLTTERAITALGTRNFWDLARSRHLRNETKNYVPQLCAAILVGRSPERYGLKVEQMSPYAYETVSVERMTSLAVLARHAGTRVETLQELNPELLRATTPPRRYALRVPPGTGQTVTRVLAGLSTTQSLDFKSYVIRKGDTLAKVAARFKLAQDDLLASNNMKRSQFKAGKRIQVPPPPVQSIDVLDLTPPAERPLSDKPLDPLPSVPPSTPQVEEPKPLPSKDVKPLPVKDAVAVVRPRYHTVKQGETLFGIAARYNIDLKLLKRWNKIKKNKIQAGQRLRLE